MDIQQIVRECGERDASCLLVAIIQYAENRMGNDCEEARSVLRDSESCIIKLAKSFARGDLIFDISILTYGLVRVSAFSNGLKEALQSNRAGGFAFAMAETAYYFSLINEGKVIDKPVFSRNEISVMVASVTFILYRVWPGLLNIDGPADMDFMKTNFWDDGRDLLILNELKDNLQASQSAG